MGKIFVIFFLAAADAIAIMSNPGSALSATLLVISAIVVYLLPSLVAANRKHANETAIVALNILLGWTFLGWVIALVWALTDNRRL
jgi:multisubunit Na+/H+ antiporter MnhB subunit